MAYRLDVGNEYIALGNTGASFVGTSALSLRILFQLNGTPTSARNRLIGKDIVTGGNGYGIRLHNGAAARFCLAWGNNTVVISQDEVPLTTGVWYDVILTYDPTKAGGIGQEKVHLYANAVDLQTDTDGEGTLGGIGYAASGDAVDEAVVLRIGMDAGSATQNAGPVDAHYVEFTRTALSAAQVTSLYNSGVFKKMSDVTVTPTYVLLCENGTTPGSLAALVDAEEAGSVSVHAGVTSDGPDATFWSAPAVTTVVRFFKHLIGHGRKIMFVGRLSATPTELNSVN